VKLKIKATPADAEVWFGTEKLGLANEELTLDKGEEEITLILNKAGFANGELKITPEKDLSETITLQGAQRPGGNSGSAGWGWD